MQRRRFIVKAGGTLAAEGATAIVDAPNVIAQPKIQWRMSTTRTPALDVLQGSAERLARLVDEMSGGRFRIEVFPGGQLMQPLACFDAASQGTDIQAFMGASYYWAVKEPAVQWFAAVPFGLLEFEAKNTTALERLKTEFRGKVEILQLAAPVLRDLKKLAADVVKEESEKSPMAKRVYASFTKFQTQFASWSHISEGAYQQFVAP